jgi:glycosyltransferase involved in cell wall biosynthesis
VSNRSLTIVLPVYNGESRLTGCVEQMLELASDLTPKFSIMIVDDGSTDDTSSVAKELSTQYPQVKVERRRVRNGLGPIISMVQQRVASDVVIVHDGVSPIDSAQVRRLWRQSDAQAAPVAASSTKRERDLSDLTAVRATHQAMAAAHERVMGFHLLEPLAKDDAADAIIAATTDRKHRAPKPKTASRAGVGHIPPLPRPNFLSAIAEFTLGE